MKNLFVTLAMILSSSSFATSDLSGVEHLKNFIGDYKIVECTVCEDQDLGRDFMIKDLKEFKLYSRQIAPVDLPRGAQIDQQISLSEIFINSKSGILGMNHDVGFQFGNYEAWKSVLNIDEKTLVYVSLRNGIIDNFHIEKVNGDFVITRKRALQDPAHYDNLSTFAYTVKAKKVN